MPSKFRPVVLGQSCFCIGSLRLHLSRAPLVLPTSTVHHQLATWYQHLRLATYQNPKVSAMGSFSLFCNFPVELQLAIWEFAAIQPETPEPEVCLAWPLNLDELSPFEVPVLPFTVDTAWPGIAHACRASREVFLASRSVRFSPVAGFAVPYRRFIPAIDTLYCGRAQIGGVFGFLTRPKNLHVARDLRHLAVELSITVAVERIGQLIYQHVACLRTLSIVVPSTMDNTSHEQHVPFLPPKRRCRLRDIPSEILNRMKIMESRRSLTPVQEYLHERRDAMETWVRDQVHVYEWAKREGTAWSTEDSCFSGLEIKAQTFVEYRSTNNQEQWVEVCQDRLLGKDGWTAPRPRRIEAADRKNPEEYRVLDDDSGLPGLEEYRADLVRLYGLVAHAVEVDHMNEVE